MFLKLISQSVVFFLPLSTSLKAFSFDFQLTITGVSIFAEKCTCHFSFSGLSHTGRILHIFLLFLLEVVLDVYLPSSSCLFIHSFGRANLRLGLPCFSLCTMLAWVCSGAVGSVSRELVFATTCSLNILSGFLSVYLLSPWQASSALWLTCNCLQWLLGLYL